MFDFGKLNVDLPRLRAQSPRAYLLAVAIMAAATLVRAELPAFQGLPYLTFFPAVVVITLVCGGAAALMATALSVCLAWAFFMPGATTFEDIYRSSMFTVGARRRGASLRTSQQVWRATRLSRNPKSPCPATRASTSAASGL